MRNYRVYFRCGYTSSVRTLYLSGPNEYEAIKALVRQGTIRPADESQTVITKFEAL